VDPVTVSITIARPREEIFAYLGDIANHPEFTDHFLKDWRLTRIESYGRGAGARFKVDAPLNRFAWADTTFVEFDPPYRIVEKGRGGKFNRIRQVGTWTLTPGSAGTTEVELTVETLPKLRSDRLMELFAGRGWFKRKHRKALRRLQTILEEGRGRGRRATIAGR
jgi:uncharacterized protein YndB with AHSA1/START domain